MQEIQDSNPSVMIVILNPFKFSKIALLTSETHLEALHWQRVANLDALDSLSSEGYRSCMCMQNP